ncbi:hypothetical protein Rsub_05536 [Raphidocelis subcapitata]|uniref:Uncharacterized protein n=1 Tax=Raphidocelis subcapitata TaxID=307507 RepID=A0A2V0NXH9_9CHLO|nr:hypothetical protein Rsub_05536 [Raphidocelis subcapitata]|eukprot:GBF92334.1 hypothetical protein Rsub_05536 [Raphidocelis subcapitata]
MPKGAAGRRAGVKASGPAAAAAAAAGRQPASAKAGRRAGGKKKASAGRGAAQPALSAAELIERAQAALAYDDYDSALLALSEAAAREPGNPEALDAYGSLLAEVGRAEEAVEVLRSAVEASPDDGFEKYMYLGQLLEGEEALAATRRGVEVLSAAADAAPRAAELRRQLCSALCSLAEMTMAAAEDPAEVGDEVGSLLERARAADAASPEPLQALASLRYEQGRQDEALSLLRQSLALWFKPEASEEEEEEEDEQEEEETEGEEEGGGGKGGGAAGGEVDMADAGAAAAAGKGGGRGRGGGGGGGGGAGGGPLRKPRTMSEDPGEDASGEEPGSSGEWEDAEGGSGGEGEEEEDDGAPSFEFRFEAAKLLLELDESTETAIQVLEGLIAENDAVPHVWHLLALAYYSGGALDEAEEVSAHCAVLLAKRARKGGGGGGGGGGEEDADVAAALGELKAAIAEARGGGGEGGGGGGEEGARC